MASMYDVIVVGAGVIGSATGYQLAKHGFKVLLIEQFSLGHSRGSSHGHSRITRKSYPEEYFARMMIEAYSAWAQLEKETNKQLFIQCGILTMGRPESDVIINTRTSLQSINSPHQMLTPNQIKERFPQIQVGSEHVALFEPEGGVLKADKCMQGLQAQFVRYGGCLHEEEPVLSITPGHPVTVNTSKDSYQAKSVIITVGPWADKVLKPLGLNLPLQVESIKVLYWRQKNQSHDPANFPTFFTDGLSGDIRHTYGLPAVEYPHHVKICPHNGPCIDPDRRDELETDKHDEEELSKMMRTHFPGLDDKPSIKEKCLYTITPDKNFIIDSHPHWKNIIIGVGFSGHGFKLAPIVGKLLGELATGQTPSYDLSPFLIKRFQQNNIKANL